MSRAIDILLGEILEAIELLQRYKACPTRTSRGTSRILRLGRVRSDDGFRGPETRTFVYGRPAER